MSVCSASIAAANQATAEEEPVRDSDEFCRRSGAGIACHFMVPYNAAVYGRATPREITADWQSLVPIPTLEQGGPWRRRR